MDAAGATSTTTARRLAAACTRLLGAADAVSARERSADAFAGLVPCDQVVVYDVDPASGQLVPAVRRGSPGTGRSGTCQSLPLIVDGEAVGLVELVRYGTAFEADEIELATALAEAAALALEAALAGGDGRSDLSRVA
jgi:hypothetical protein